MRKYLYIDGASFEALMRPFVEEIFPGEGIWDVADLASIASDYSRTFYYDSLPIKGTATDQEFQKELDAKQAIFDRINSVPNCHVHSGMLRHRKKAGAGREQKGVDVMLAIQVIQHAYQGNMDQATILTSDLDFFPIFDALTATKVNSVLMYNPSATSKDLIHSADRAIPMGKLFIANFLKDKLREKFRLIGSGSTHSGLPLVNTRKLETNIGSFLLGIDGDGAWVAVGPHPSTNFFRSGSSHFLEAFIYEQHGRA